jgi:hypothetical protein
MIEYINDCGIPKENPCCCRPKINKSCALLLECGDYLLQECGNKILLENG